ncbi:MAG: glucosaminidase domain-containing protein [Prevotella sp.]|nr:glucosaminidase domain-containing protein [Prevotella sp.]
MKRALFSLFLLSLLAVGASSQRISRNKAYLDYFEQYKDIAIEQMHRYRIPASITLAQGALESGAGKSELTRKANNHFGIKCHGWTGRKSYHNDDQKGECFRAYRNARESYEDHAVFLTTGKRYSRLFELKATDYKGWARGLKACGYATSPVYASKLIEIIEVYELYRYDHAKRHGKSMFGSGTYVVREFNKNSYVIARKGDTFRIIAGEFDMSYRKLARYNERDKRDVLEEGEKIWLKKKRTKAPKEYKHKLHVVAAGESMYSISQEYGIRLKNLYKMNGLAPDYAIKVGDRLRLR